MKEIHKVLEKLYKMYELLSKIEDVPVGTTPKEVVYKDRLFKIYHYLPLPDKPVIRTPTLLVYALINKSFILDLHPERSFIYNLLRYGVDVFLIDWIEPQKKDMYVTLDDYIDLYLDTAVEFVADYCKVEKINLLGICQGGTFSVIYTALYPYKIKNLVTVVTPVDFSSDGLLYKWAENFNVSKFSDSFGVIPGDVLNFSFLFLSPIYFNVGKYINFLEMFSDKEKFIDFLSLEKWIYENPAIAGTCFKQFIEELVKNNKLVKGEFQINGKLVKLENITVPLLNVYGSADPIVPPEVAQRLTDLVSSTDKQNLCFIGTHIGFIGTKYIREPASKIAAWLQARD